MTPTPKKTSAAGGNQRGGKDQNTYEGDRPMSTIPVTVPPVPSWAVKRQHNEELSVVTDWTELTTSGYSIQIFQDHTISTDRTVQTSDITALIKWEQRYAEGSSREEFELPVSDISHLIQALSLTVAEVTK
ncbi:hypothetical protein [Microbacterium sp. YY-01]|uniref:hypothetical protein n=1 Tax=Microbacterium sp. YY-01 TaxID=3421634 RepID=UPI003D17DEFA